MVRDTLRDEKYFKEYIKSEEKTIKEFENLVNQVIRERGESDKGVKSGYNFLFGNYFNKMEAMYSFGASLEQIKLFYEEVIDITEKNWSSESKYVEMIWLLSIAIMLKIESSQMERLKNLITKDGVEDYLIDYLIADYDNNWKIRTKKFKFDVPYKSLYQVINAENKEKSVLLLKRYLEEEWYEGHDDAGWYDTHKQKDELIYSGYWSFESGAIAKIQGLDDSSLKDTPYYPYDMVHYQGK